MLWRTTELASALLQLGETIAGWMVWDSKLLEDAGFCTKVFGLKDELVKSIRATLYLLQAAVGFVLLIGCVSELIHRVPIEGILIRLSGRDRLFPPHSR